MKRSMPAIVWRRHPADAARLVAFGLVLGFLLLLAAWEEDALTGLSDGLVTLFGNIPASIRDAIGGVAQVFAVVAPVLAVAWLLWLRAFRLLAVVAACAAAAAGAMAVLTDWLNRTAPPRPASYETVESWITGRDFPSATYVAGLAAVVTAISPLLTPKWRRVAWWAVAIAALFRVLTAAVVPVSAVTAVAVGVAVGSAVLVALGAPSRRYDPAQVTAALGHLGLAVERIEAVTGGTRRTYRADLGDGRTAHVAWIGRDERDVELLYRAWRALRVREIDDELVGIRADQQVRREALATLLASEGGARVPSVLAVGDSADGDGILAVDLIDGPPLAELDVTEVTDELLEALWAQVALLHGRRIAHRRLSADEVLLTADGPVLVDLRWASVGAEDLQLAADVAELLVATAAIVGAERAVAAARTHQSDEALAGALPLVQNLALSPATRRASKADKELLPAVRDAVQSATGVDAVELYPLERVGLTQIIGVFGFFVLAWFVLTLVSNWSDISEALREADWTRIPAVFVLAMATYPAGALSLMGAVARPVPFLPTTVVMFGQSFLNRFTPANAGGMAMRVRYLQKGGSDIAVAAAAVGLTSAASGVMQVVLILTFFLWAGASPGGVLELPKVESLPVVVLVVVAVVALITLLPWTRTRIVRLAKTGWAKFGPELRSLAHQPSKLGLLFGGALLSKLLTIVCFIASCRALGITIGFAELGALYMTGNTVGSAVPTPGGVGGIEAALIALLTGAGVDPAAASAAVLIFRLMTYWIPVIPGYLGLRLSRRMDLV